MEDVFAAIDARPKRRQGITGQTIEAQMRGTMCQITEYELDTLRDEISRLTAERDQALARLAAAQLDTVERCAALLIELGHVSESGETLAKEVRGLRLAPDAEAALQRVVDAAREELVRDLLARHEAEMRAKFRNPADHTSKWTQAANAIRALKRPEASHE